MGAWKRVLIAAMEFDVLEHSPCMRVHRKRDVDELCDCLCLA